MKYHNLYLKIQDEDSSLLIELSCPIIGVYEGKNISPPIPHFFLGSFIDGLERIAKNPNLDDSDWLIEKGKSIYNELFSQPWREYWQQALVMCQQKEAGLRINILAQGKIAEETPWEILYDPQSNQFISCTHNCVIVRSQYCEESAKQKNISKLPVRILAASASPPRYSNVHPDLELAAVRERLDLLPSYVVDFFEKPRTTWEEFVSSLQVQSPQVVHLVAHGDERGVFFEDGSNIDYGTLVRQLSAIQGLRILILSGCNSKYVLRYKGLISDQVSIPSEQGIWALLVTGTIISSAASLSFMKFLYTSLAMHNSLTYAVGCARNSLAGSNTPEALQWSIPMLHDICDVVIFPPIKELLHLSDVSAFQLEEIFELRQKVNEAVIKVSEFQEWLNDCSHLSSDFFDMMSNQPKQVEPELIYSVVDKLGNIHNYPNDLTRWISSTRNLALSTYEAFDQCANKINSLSKSGQACISNREIQSIRRFSSQANEEAKGLKKQFDRLFYAS